MSQFMQNDRSEDDAGERNATGRVYVRDSTGLTDPSKEDQ
jgi:hypothetical protein